MLLHFDLVLEVTGGLLGRGHADIARLLAKQAGKSADRKVRAAGELADALLDAAEDKSRRALSALKSIGVDLLGKAVGSADEEVRTRAADALRKLRSAP